MPGNRARKKDGVMKNRERLRLGLIICLQVLGLLTGIGPGCAQSDGPPKQSPPYANVWEWTIPKGARVEPGLMVWRRADGDALIYYGVLNPKGRPGRPDCQPGVFGCLARHGVTFFGRESVPPGPSAKR